jgi:preprotein translocase subunit SecD
VRPSHPERRLRLVSIISWLLVLGGCAGERAPAIQEHAPPDSVMVRERRTNDSLVRAALAEDGARLEFRWVVALDSAPSPDRTSLFDPGLRQWLILNDTVALDLAMADGVVIGVGSSGTPVGLRLGMAAGDRFLSSTTRHVGSHLAVVLNGHLLVAPAPVVQSPLAGFVTVAHNLDSAVARDLAERLRTALSR